MVYWDIMTNKYKEVLEQKLVEITEELKAVGIHNPQNPSDWIAVPEELDAEEPDENLSADAVEAWNERTALVATLEKDYNGIISALARIEKDAFGTCEICGKQIEEKRLDANPISRTCIEHRENENTLEN